MEITKRLGRSIHSIKNISLDGSISSLDGQISKKQSEELYNRDANILSVDGFNYERCHLSAIPLEFEKKQQHILVQIIH